MSSRTRYFVIASLLVLGVGLGTGLIAYYVGFPTRAFSLQGGPDELRYVPANASLLAVADVHQIMTSDVRQKIRTTLPDRPNGQREFQDRTGINIETDIDRVVAFVAPPLVNDGRLPGAGMVLARGRFDEVKIEALMRDHGGQVEEYKGKRLIVSDGSQQKASMSLAFLEPGLVAVGTSDMVRGAVDLKDGGPTIMTNDEMMAHVHDVAAATAWAAGRFDVLTSHARLPANVTEHLPPITWFAANADFDGGLRGTVRADARDEASANNLRDVVRGFMALAKLQAGPRPEFQTLLQSLQLGGSGNTVALSFTVPLEVFDAARALAEQHRTRPGQRDGRQ
jgi:hypothetical protein